MSLGRKNNAFNKLANCISNLFCYSEYSLSYQQFAINNLSEKHFYRSLAN